MPGGTRKCALAMPVFPPAPEEGASAADVRAGEACWRPTPGEADAAQDNGLINGLAEKAPNNLSPHMG